MHGIQYKAEWNIGFKTSEVFVSLSQASVVSHEHYVFTPLQVSEVGQRDQIVVVIIPRLSTATSLRSITRSPFAFVALSLSLSHAFLQQFGRPGGVGVEATRRLALYCTPSSHRLFIETFCVPSFRCNRCGPCSIIRFTVINPTWNKTRSKRLLFHHFFLSSSETTCSKIQPTITTSHVDRKGWSTSMTYPTPSSSIMWKEIGIWIDMFKIYGTNICWEGGE